MKAKIVVLLGLMMVAGDVMAAREPVPGCRTPLTRVRWSGAELPEARPLPGSSQAAYCHSSFLRPSFIAEGLRWTVENINPRTVGQAVFVCQQGRLVKVVEETTCERVQLR